MFDAEIAAVLLNRRKLAGEAAAALLDEGNLSFVREAGSLAALLAREDALDGQIAPSHIECLLFPDGSRALRIGLADGATGWTRWNAIEPATMSVHLSDAAIAASEE